MTSKATLKYLASYAEPEAAFAERIADSYHVALIVPALGESVSLLAGLHPALQHGPGKALVIVVVNAREDSAPALKQANVELATHLLASGEPVSIATTPLITLVRSAPADLLLIDRSSAGAWLPKKQGVGLARRIGCDVALALHARGALESPWLFTSDADVTLPNGYFAATQQIDPGVSALLYPFWHTASGDGAVDLATADYEAWLRYYVLGLAWAGSPYAYHSLGSTLAIHAEAYASVRGFPRRDAAEDFYLLDKLGKVAPLRRLHEPEIRIRSRTSRRVPFGTGARVTTLVAKHETLSFYDPRVFEALRWVLDGLTLWAVDPAPATFARRLQQAPEGLARALTEAVDQLGLPAALTANRESSSPEVRLRRAHTWLDAFRTLRLIHLLEAKGCPRVPWVEAVRRASFLGGLLGAATEHASEAREALLEMESHLPVLVGPSLPNARVAEGAPAR